MAILVNSSSSQQIVLLGKHLFGRQAGESDTLLTDPNVSRLHAWVFWGGDEWFLQDSSTNGTFVNNVRVKPGAKVSLRADDKINFGNKNGDAWVLLNVEAPKTMLLATDESLSDIVLDNIVALPSEDNPEITIYFTPEGRWVCESKLGVTCLKNGDSVGINGSIWRFVEAEPALETVLAEVEGSVSESLSNVQAIFNVSQDEEHVSLKVIVNDYELDLKQRIHHYLMLVLARKRLKDIKEGFQCEEQGWIDKDELDQLVGLNETHINIQVYRFRKQIIKALPSHLVLPQIIESRRGAIRFAPGFIKISGGFEELAL